MAWEKTPSGIWSPQRTAFVTRNYLNAYRSAPEHLRKLGAQFYPEWNATGEVIGNLTGTSTTHGSAVLAHLSPSTEAEVNRLMGLQLASRATPKMLKNLSEAGDHLTASKSAKTAARYKEGAERGNLLALAAKHDEANKQLRQKAGIVGTPLGFQSSGALGNAARVLLGHHDDDVLGSLGALKIYDFGQTINDPNHPLPPIDTHYHDVGLNRLDIPYDEERGLNQAASRYKNFQNSSTRAHAQYMEETGDIIPHSAFMGGAWYAHQQRKALGNPDSLSARRASETKINRIVNNPQFSDFMPERFGLPPSFGKIDTRL